MLERISKYKNIEIIKDGATLKDIKYWNLLFQNRKSDIPVDQELVNNIELLKTGTVLDVGSGDGRNARYLAELGFELTCIDFSEIGINKIKSISKKYKLGMITKVIDINNKEEINELDTFDNIISIHSYVDIAVFKNIINKCKIKGMIYLSSYIKESVDKDSALFSIAIPRRDIKLIKKCGEVIKEFKMTNDRGMQYYLFIRKS